MPLRIERYTIPSTIADTVTARPKMMRLHNHLINMLAQKAYTGVNDVMVYILDLILYITRLHY